MKKLPFKRNQYDSLCFFKSKLGANTISDKNLEDIFLLFYTQRNSVDFCKYNG